MITIDGAAGEGGGQILRSSLTLSLVTGRPFRIDNIRAGRAKPGLLRQHLTAVRAVAEIGSADVDGATLGSSCVQFRPGAVRGGDYSFSIGTAGSTTLVLQTVLLPLALAGTVSRLVLGGGTHNESAPPFEFLQHAFLPLLRRIGFSVSAKLVRHGFFPAGGGEIEVSVFPPGQPLRPLAVEARGVRIGRNAEAIVSALPEDIAARELAVLGRRLDWPPDALATRSIPRGRGPGNVVVVTVAHANVTEVFTGFGRIGLPAEQVAGDVAAEALAYLASGAAVGPHLADQLLLPMALGAGGSFVTTALTAHTTTNIDTLRRFLDVATEVTPLPGGLQRIRVGESAGVP